MPHRPNPFPAFASGWVKNIEPVVTSKSLHCCQGFLSGKKCGQRYPGFTRMHVQFQHVNSDEYQATVKGGFGFSEGDLGMVLAEDGALTEGDSFM